jgi:hypothetical protein
MAGGLGQCGFGRREALSECEPAFDGAGNCGSGGIGIAFIVDPGQPGMAGIGLDLATRHIEQRAQQAQAAEAPLGGNAGCTGHTGTAQQVEEHRLGLVAPVMSQQQQSPANFGKPS